jgi:hypothetical protein
MATNNRPLKAYVRYDGSVRAVSSSLIWRKNKPKVGNWKEVQGYECCSPYTGLYAIALYPQGSAPDTDARAYYTDRDLQNIAGQCSDSTLAIGAKLYLDPQGTTPVTNGNYKAVDGNPILFGILYIVADGVIVDALCP